MNKIVTAMAAVLLVSAAAGCTSASSTPLPPLGPIPIITTVAQLTRPIDPYLATAAQVDELLKATAIVANQCLAGYGLPPVPMEATNLDDAATKNTERSQLFGSFEPDAVAAKGYDLIEIGPATTAAEQPSPATLSVLEGRNIPGAVVSSYEGKPVPSGGCHQTGIKAIGGNPPIPEASAGLPDGGPTIPVTDPRMTAVNARWSACMKSKGFTYSSPADAFMDNKWRFASNSTPLPMNVQNPAEIPTATADLACKLSTNLMGVAVAVQSAYDQQYIAAHAAQLAALRQTLQTQLAKAELIIASSAQSAG